MTLAVLFHQDAPVAAYASSSEAMRAIHDLPSCLDAELFLVSVPFQPVLASAGGGLVAMPGREPRASGAAPGSPLTLSPNGNKIT